MNSIALWLTVAVVGVATVTDLRGGRIPNWLVLPFLALGFAVAGFSSGVNGLEQSLIGVLTATVVMGLFCLSGGMGMGDLKLCAAVGAWIGPSQMFVALVLTGLAGAMMAVCWALVGGFLSDVVKGVVRNPALPRRLSRKMPYAPAIAIGTILSFFGRHA